MNLEVDLKQFLNTVVADPPLHARFLNTISFLEYVGFRKIVKSQPAETLSLTALSHASEEGRHALLLKRLAMQEGGAGFDNYRPESLLCGDQAEEYFQLLDHRCLESLLDHFSETQARTLTYFYVTWLVELRALSVYGAYLEVLSQHGRRSPLISGLLAEEDKHLNFVLESLRKMDPCFESRGIELQRLENELYQDFLRQWIYVVETQTSESSVYVQVR